MAARMQSLRSILRCKLPAIRDRGTMDRHIEPWPARVIVYYDGDCALCNWWVARCLARGVPPGVRFAPQDGELFGRLIGLRPDLAGVDSMVVQSFPVAGPDAVHREHGSAGQTEALSARKSKVGPDEDRSPGSSSADLAGEVRIRSEAVFWLASRLRGPERWLARLPRVVPRTVLDWGYAQVAKNRRRVGGRLPECPVPTPEQRRYFLA